MAARMRDTGSALGCAFDGGCTSGSITIGWELTVNGEATGETFTDFAAATATVAALNQSQPQNQATLTVSTSSGAQNPSGIDFPRGDGIGPVSAPGQGWFYNVLLTGTLPSGTDASQFQIKQDVVDEGSATTETGKRISLNSKHRETIAPAKTKYWVVHGSVVYALDSPGLAILDPRSKEFFRSATLTMHFESWVAKGKTRVSPVVKWNVKITVQEFEGKITGGAE